MQHRAMEMSHRGVEAESLLRPDQKPVVMPHNSLRPVGWEGSETEKAPFLRNEPVKLTPAWEGSNLPNDTLNLKGVTMDLAPPKDRLHLIYITMLLHGVGTLTAWNMFITAQNYFEGYKLVDSVYSENYMVYVGFASQVPNLFFSWFNVFANIKGSLATRIVWSLTLEVLIFVVTVALAMIDTSNWKGVFFWITMISVFFMNGFNAIFQNSVYGVASRLPPSYTGCVVLGSNICGTVVTLLAWLTDEFSDNVRTAAIYYFIGGMFVLLICFDTYFALPLNRFYRYYDTLQQRTLRVNPALAATAAPAASSRPPYNLIIRQAWVQLYNVLITFIVSLAIFPAVQSKIQSTQEESFLGKNFVRITCFLTFNLMAMIGSITGNLFQYPRPRWLALFTTLRILFIPLFLICNVKLEQARTLPVYIQNDWVYWALAAFMAWSSGHFSSLAMMYISGTVAPENATKAVMMGGATIVTGIVSGLFISRLGPIIITSPIWSSI